MIPLRLRLFGLPAILLVFASGCERIAVGPEIARELRRGRAYADSIVTAGRVAPPDDVTTSLAIALGYLERHRLGLGSPFRLIEYALRDPRLVASTREAVAWALLARTLDGAGDRIDPIVFDSVQALDAVDGMVDGREHLRLLERVMRDAHDPRTGELAVRLAYRIAAAERRVSPEAPLLAARAAALLRDRLLARADANDLLRAAWRRNGDPLEMVRLWREERRFRVEQPSLARGSAEMELEAMKLAPRIVEAIRSLSEARPEDDASPSAHAPSPSLLGEAAAELAHVARFTNAPPQAPVVVPIAGHRAALLAGELAAEAHEARARFMALARNEEALAAEHAIVSATAPGTAVERATLAAAVALRTYAQERPWLPGQPGPSTRELIGRFGLAAVTFDPDTPESWKPYYRTLLGVALEDLTRILPSLAFDGLRVHFGESPLRGAALALHDPRRRTLYLPLATSAGAIAHELAHDIDWQAARTRYAVRGDYATDRAMREVGGGPLALSMRGLTAASLAGATDHRSRAQLSARPTEVFARSVDWFVAVSLAHEGRLDGYLSSVQDDLLTGYVTVTPPDVTGEAGLALITVLDDVAPPAPAVRASFLARYGPGRALTPYDLVRRVLETPLDTSSGMHRAPVELAMRGPGTREIGLMLAGEPACWLVGAVGDRGGGGDDNELAAARQRLVELAAEARLRGLAHDRAVRLAAATTWRWAALAPYAAAQPFVLAGALRPAAEGELALWAQALDGLASTAPGRFGGGCTIPVTGLTIPRGTR